MTTEMLEKIRALGAVYEKQRMAFAQFVKTLESRHAELKMTSLQFGKSDERQIAFNFAGSEYAIRHGFDCAKPKPTGLVVLVRRKPFDKDDAWEEVNGATLAFTSEASLSAGSTAFGEQEGLHAFLELIKCIFPDRKPRES